MEERERWRENRTTVQSPHACTGRLSFPGAVQRKNLERAGERSIDDVVKLRLFGVWWDVAGELPVPEHAVSYFFFRRYISKRRAFYNISHPHITPIPNNETSSFSRYSRLIVPLRVYMLCYIHNPSQCRPVSIRYQNENAHLSSVKITGISTRHTLLTLRLRLLWCLVGLVCLISTLCRWCLLLGRCWRTVLWHGRLLRRVQAARALERHVLHLVAQIGPLLLLLLLRRRHVGFVATDSGRHSDGVPVVDWRFVAAGGKL